MPCIDITGVDWDEVGPDLYLALRDVLTVVERQGLKRLTGDSRESNWMMLNGISKVLDAARQALARVEGKE